MFSEILYNTRHVDIKFIIDIENHTKKIGYKLFKNFKKFWDNPKKSKLPS
jgi:hypothetical protein